MHYKYHEDDAKYHNHVEMNKFILDFNICITCTKVIKSFEEETHVLRKTSAQHTH